MKKILIVFTLFLGLVSMASAQPKSIGLRFGAKGAEISYQHYLNNPNFLEGEFGLYYGHGNTGFTATCLYNWQIATPNWSKKGEWGVYAGPGVSLGMIPHIYYTNLRPFIGVVGQIGLEYTFWFPLQLSLDIRPTIPIAAGEFYNDYLNWSFMPRLSVRYSF